MATPKEEAQAERLAVNKANQKAQDEFGKSLEEKVADAVKAGSAKK